MAVFKKILIPFDGSEPSKKAAEKAFELAVDQGAEVYGIKVISFIGELITPSDSLWATIEADLREKARSILKELETMAENKGVKITTTVREGSAESEVINYAKEIGADLIVMSTGGKGGMGRYLGKTADRVMREAPCPVMVVK